MAVAIKPVDPRELQLRGIVSRNGYERWLAREVEAVLEAAFREITTRLLTAGDALQLRDRHRLQSLFSQITQQLTAAYGDVARRTATELGRYGATEVEASAAAIDQLLGGALGAVSGSLAVLSHQLVQSIATLPIQGLTLGEWWQSQAASMAITTRRAIQSGLVLGEGSRDIVRRIVPARDSTAPAVWRRARAEAAAIVRTSMTAVHTDAATATYQGLGAEVTEEYELVTARDSRVSKICAALDGLRFRYNDPRRKIPPFHIHCRTTVVPVINYARFGLTPPPAARAGGITFRSMDAWLRSATKTTQAEILGPTRAEWYREGRMSLRDLIDSDNRVFTLPELRDRLGIERAA